jgi:hypothetical protein
MLGQTQADRLAVLRLLLADTDPDQLPTLDSRSLDDGPHDEAARHRHMNEDWFGRSRPDGRGPWRDQAEFDPARPRATGYWNNWYGDARGIVTQTFVRALEVSLGLEHVAPDDGVDQLRPSRFWPIEIFWRCPAPWLEGWVTWRREPDGTGHVTVHLHTPGHAGSALLLSPVRAKPHRDLDDYEDEPTRCDRARGMWVIAHRHQRQWPHYAVTNPTPPGDWRLPSFGPFVESHGPIVAVQPNEPDGGVLADGRPYTP